MAEVDPFAELKAKQREGWAHFAPVEVHTAQPAAHLVRFAGVKPGHAVLDVGTGTGVVAVTARRAGARVVGLDLTPALLDRARENAALAEVDVEWHEGDVERLPFGDAAFDVVVSQFGHMFAPRPDVAAREMLRVLRPGGTIAFATWPPEHAMGELFAAIARFSPAPPPGAAPPTSWGVPAVVAERLGAGVRDLRFERGTLRYPTLSPQHYRHGAEQTAGPLVGLVRALAADPARLAELRREVEAVAARHLVDNAVLKDYLLTRATKQG